MKNIKGSHCANCYHCRSKSGRAWCSKGLWLVNKERGIKVETDVRCLYSAKQYKEFAKQCPDYQGMEG